jgi:hypothetical protein
MSARESSPAVGIVVECELSVEVPAIAAPAPGMTALVLVRLFSEPIGMLSLTLSERGLEPAELAAEIAGELGSELRQRFADCAIAWTGSLPTNGLEPGRTPSFIEGRAVPSVEHERIHGVSKLRPLRDGMRVLRTIIRERLPRRRGDEIVEASFRELPFRSHSRAGADAVLVG